MTRRRRNILIGVAAGVMLVGFWQWWNWPRIDVRLVGEWAVIQSDDVPTGRILSLFADGSGWNTDSLNTVQWRVIGEYLVLRPRSGEFTDDVLQFVGIGPTTTRLRIRVVQSEEMMPTLIELIDSSGVVDRKLERLIFVRENEAKALTE